jgi:hypothetical protein
MHSYFSLAPNYVERIAIIEREETGEAEQNKIK